MLPSNGWVPARAALITALALLPPCTSAAAMTAVDLWPNSTIPYRVDNLIKRRARHLASAMTEWSRRTCIRFVGHQMHDAHKAWVIFDSKQGCMDCHGAPKVEGELPFRLENEFWDDAQLRNGYAHDLGRLIGLAREHQRSDRDEHVQVFEENIKPGYSNRFQKDSATNITLPFDHGSVMIFGPKAFNMKGRPTMKTVMESKKIVPADWPTKGDLTAVNDAYQCHPRLTNEVPDCYRPLASNQATTNYTFYIDSVTQHIANNEKGLGFVRVHLHCSSSRKMWDENRMATVPLDHSGPDKPYKVTLPRCSDRHGRHIKWIEVRLCREQNMESCDIECGHRRICPVDSNKKGIFGKAIDLVDETIWMCTKPSGAY